MDVWTSEISLFNQVFLSRRRQHPREKLKLFKSASWLQNVTDGYSFGQDGITEVDLSSLRQQFPRHWTSANEDSGLWQITFKSNEPYDCPNLQPWESFQITSQRHSITDETELGVQQGAKSMQDKAVDRGDLHGENSRSA